MKTVEVTGFWYFSGRRPSLAKKPMCKGYLISHGLRRRIKITVASVPTSGQRPQDDVKDHVKQAWEKIKVDLTNDDDDGDDQMQDKDDVDMSSPQEEAQQDEGNDYQESGANDINAEKRDYGSKMRLMSTSMKNARKPTQWKKKELPAVTSTSKSTRQMRQEMPTLIIQHG